MTSYEKSAKILGIRSAKGKNLRSTVHDDCPVHQLDCEIAASDGRHAENGHHDENEGAGHHADRLAKFTQMPWASAETVANEEDADEDGDGKCDICSNSTN